MGALKVRQHVPPAFNTWGGSGYGNSPFGSGGFWKW
jgi:hypothetical protein